ncbi:hypothetical protein [Streptomyces sp. NPDC048650]|uniref:hypothetical protein n=1 Tax=unclassified Streptomyces TaxID=2593676 RepID=UPI00371352BD
MSVERSDAGKLSKLRRIAVGSCGLAVFGMIEFVRSEGWRNPRVFVLSLTFVLSAGLSILALRKGRMRLAILALAILFVIPTVYLALRSWWPPF